MKSREEIARELVGYHIVVEDEILCAFHYVQSGGDRADEPVKILEVSRATVPAGIAPVYFGATRDVPLPVVIIEITEEEYRDVEAGRLLLPDGWDEARELHRRAA